MLQAIRDKVTGWIAYAIIFLISIPFALWGVNSYLGGGELQPAALVNGVEISSRELDTAYTNYRQRLANLFGGTLPAGFSDENSLREQVLSQLIEEYALRLYAEKQGYRIGDEALNRLIREMEVFHSGGQFDSEIYQAQLGSQGYSPASFEQQFRQNQSMGQLQTAINATAFSVPIQQKQFASLANQTRKFRVLTWPLNSDAYSVTDSEISDYYEKNASRYMVPEQIKIDYIEVSLARLKALVDVSEELLLERYQQSIDAYTSEEFRTASHILLTLKAGDSEEESARVRDQLTQIRARIMAGEDFADLARETSQDPGSAADGGSLGEIERGTMVQPFEDALYAMQAGDVSEPIKTAFGWHLIKLEQVRGGETRSFDEVRAAIEDEIRSDLAENQIYDMVDNLANLAYEQPDSLEPAAQQLGLTLHNSDWFDRRSGSGIAQDSQIRTAAFSNEVLSQGLNSDAIELADNRVVFIRLNNHKPTEQQPLSEVRDNIVASLKRQKAREENERLGQQALEELNAGKSLDEIADKWKLDIFDAGFVGRNDSEIDRNLLSQVFKMEKPVDGLAYAGLTQTGGDYSLIELSAVISNDEVETGEVVESLVSSTAESDYLAFVKLLASRAEVVRTPVGELQ